MCHMLRILHHWEYSRPFKAFLSYCMVTSSQSCIIRLVYFNLVDTMDWTQNNTAYREGTGSERTMIMVMTSSLHGPHTSLARSLYAHKRRFPSNVLQFFYSVARLVTRSHVENVRSAGAIIATAGFREKTNWLANWCQISAAQLHAV